MTDDTPDNDSEEDNSPWGETIAPNEGSGPGTQSSESETPSEQNRRRRQTEPTQSAPDESAPGEPTTDTATTQNTSPPPIQESPPDQGGRQSGTDQGGQQSARENSDKQTAERDRPEELDNTTGGAFGARNHTQDLVDFDVVFDQDDSFTPNEVNADGIIKTPDGNYVGIASVTARSWSIHTDQKKNEIIQGYQSGFLSTLDFYTQIVCYPTEFDMSEHVDRLEQRVREMGDSTDEGDLIKIGRQLYPTWLNSFIRRNELTQRDYYVIVRVDPTELRQFDETESFGDKIVERASAFEPIVRALGGLSSDESAPEASRQECIQEVHARLSQVSSALQQIDVDVDRVDDRDEALSVIYHYYNNTRPERTSFDVSTRTDHDPDAPLDVDESQIDDLLRPNYETQEET